MKKIFYLLLTLVATTTLGASNVITYTATSKLVETANSLFSPGLHTDAFNVTISSHTFSNGTGAITFVGEVTTIRDYAFYSCSGLKAITIPYSVTEIGWSAFSGCSGLTKTNYTGTIADWCKIKFGDNSSNPMYNSHNFFINDIEVKDLVIPEGVDTIGNYAFLDCYGLTSVTIPNSVTSIGGSAFSGCDSLTKTNYTGTIADWCKIQFGGWVANPISFSHNFFINDVEIKDLIIPEGVDTIGNYAFYGCSGLTSITIPSSVTTIRENAFSGCSGLTSITIPSSVTTIGVFAFCYCEGLTSITIPNSITTIENGAFEYCSGLTSVTIPNSVTTIGNYAFYGCSGLTSMTIPHSVTTIGNYAFFFCEGLTSVTIGNSVKTIGDYAFSYCGGLTSVTIPSSVTTIGEAAFAYCRGLTSVIIGNSVTTIEYWAFHDCSSLESITCLALVPPLLPKDTIAFEGVPRDIPLYVPAKSVSAYQAAEQWNEFEINPLVIDVDPITPDTTQLSWLPVDSASLYKLRIYSEQIELDTTLLIEADSLNGGIRIPVTLVPNRDRHMPMNDIGSVVIIIIEPRSGITTETPFVVTVSTTSKDKINVGFDLTVLKGETTIKQESGNFALNAPISDGLEDVPISRFGVSSGIYDLYGRHYLLNQWNQLPAGIYILRDGEKASKVMKR